MMGRDMVTQTADRSVFGAARSHFQKEEQVLFPMARRLLGDEELTRLGSAWAEARRVTID